MKPGDFSTIASAKQKRYKAHIADGDGNLPNLAILKIPGVFGEFLGGILFVLEGVRLLFRIVVIRTF